MRLPGSSQNLFGGVPVWACSSVVEHCVDIAGVASSILATPTIFPRRDRLLKPELDPAFMDHIHETARSLSAARKIERKIAGDLGSRA